MALLEVTELTKIFGGLVAVDKVSFNVSSGQIKAIIGPNGAGKTTIFNLLSGLEVCTGGKIAFKGQAVSGLKSHHICSLGIGRTFQNTQLFGEMTVLENVMVGRHCRTRSELLAAAFKLPFTREEEKDILTRSYDVLKSIGLAGRAGQLAKNLSHGERRLLEIARALATEPELLLLDEPAAGLNSSETDLLGETIYKIRSKGITVLLVEHDMGLVMRISDEVLVLDYGRKIAEGPPLLIQEDEQVITAYLGEEIKHA